MDAVSADPSPEFHWQMLHDYVWQLAYVICAAVIDFPVLV